MSGLLAPLARGHRVRPAAARPPWRSPPRPAAHRLRRRRVADHGGRLAAAHPEITTYAGNSVTEGFEGTIRLDVGPLGFHASVRGGHASWYIDPAYIGDTSLYLSYFGDALPVPERSLSTPPRRGDRRRERSTRVAGTRSSARAPDATGQPAVSTAWPCSATRRTPCSSPPVSMIGPHEAESNTAVLAAKTTLMNRVNQIYNDDLAVKMILVNGTDRST